MSIQSEVNRLKTNVSNSFAAVSEKGGTVAAGANSDDLAASIRTIPSGADLNFEIVGGTEQPTNPKENTIWVKTGTGFPEWGFDTETPVSPEDGVVWFLLNDKTGVKFNALKENSVFVCPSAALQYVSGAWVEIEEAFIYQNGVWNKLSSVVKLFDNGDQCTDKTGGWNVDYKASGYDTGGGLKNDAVGDVLEATAKSGSSSNSGGVVGTNSPVDLSAHTIMRVKGNLSAYHSSAVYYIGINKSTTITSSPLAFVSITAKGDFEKTLSLPDDVSSAYVFVLACLKTEGSSSTYSDKLTVTEITLE